MSVSSVCGHIQAVEVGSPGGGVGGEKLYTALCQNGGIVVMELTSLLAGAHEPPEGRSADSWAPATGTRDTHNFSLIIFLQVLSIEIEALTGHYLFSGSNALNKLCVSV